MDYRIRRYGVMKRMAAYCLVIGIVLVSVCAKAHALEASAQDTAASAAESITSATSNPPVEGASNNAIRRITDTWYLARTEQMRLWMRQFGSYESDGAIEEQITRWEVDPGRPMIALTFDDGPLPRITDKILGVLARYGVRATFFVVGIQAEREPELLRRAVAQGCEIGNHSWDHLSMENLGWEQTYHEIADTNKAIYNAIGVETHLLRPPGGNSRGCVLTAAEACDMAIVCWSQSGNAYLTDPALIAANVMRQEIDGRELRDGDIVLLHDIHDHMIEAVEILIPMLLERGYQFVTVTELLMLSEHGIVYGESYTRQ